MRRKNVVDARWLIGLGSLVAVSKASAINTCCAGSLDRVVNLHRVFGGDVYGLKKQAVRSRYVFGCFGWLYDLFGDYCVVPYTINSHRCRS